MFNTVIAEKLILVIQTPISIAFVIVFISTWAIVIIKKD